MKFNNQKGQGLIEYLIIVALVGVATIAVMRVVGQNVKAQFARVSSAIQGKKSNAHLSSVRASQYKNSDLSNFFSGSSSKGEADDVEDNAFETP